MMARHYYYPIIKMNNNKIARLDSACKIEANEVDFYVTVQSFFEIFVRVEVIFLFYFHIFKTFVLCFSFSNRIPVENYLPYTTCYMYHKNITTFSHFSKINDSKLILEKVTETIHGSYYYHHY